jgi:hypothetical protein
MICPKCGVEVADDAKFCTSCGTKIYQGNESATQDSANSGSFVNEGKKNSTFESLEKVGTIITGILSVLSVIMVIGAFLGVFDKNPVPFFVFIGVVLLFGWLADKLPNVPKIVFAVLEIVALIICFNIAGSATTVAMVKGGSPDSYPNITYEEAFEDYFSNATWKDAGTDEDGNKVVKFTGNCYYLDEVAVAEIKFTVYEDQERFVVSSVKINGSDMDWLGNTLVMDAFEEYGQSN